MEVWAERHHWLNTIVGLLDAAFRLTDEEQFFTFDIVARLLDSLDIPFRSEPDELPSAVLLEVSSSMFSVQLSSPRDSGLARPVRQVSHGDMVVSVEAWRNALLGLLTTAYPDLDPTERMVAAKVFDDLLVAIGVPHRAAVFFPDEVVRAYSTTDAVPFAG